MTTTENEIGFNLTGLRVLVGYEDPTGITDGYQLAGVVVDHDGSVVRVETDEDENGDTDLVLALLDEIEIVVPTVLLADETDRPDDSPLIDPDAVDGVYRLEY